MPIGGLTQAALTGWSAFTEHGRVLQIRHSDGPSAWSVAGASERPSCRRFLALLLPLHRLHTRSGPSLASRDDTAPFTEWPSLATAVSGHTNGPLPAFPRDSPRFWVRHPLPVRHRCTLYCPAWAPPPWPSHDGCVTRLARVPVVSITKPHWSPTHCEPPSPRHPALLIAATPRPARGSPRRRPPPRFRLPTSGSGCGGICCPVLVADGGRIGCRTHGGG